MDVDHFKILNDTEGHQQGDYCLIQLAAELQRMARRETDLVARYGGEEFAIVLPATDAADAMQFAENVRQAILDLHLSNSRSPVLPILSISVGVGTAQHGSTGSADEFMAAVDRALYIAKRSGRNRSVFFNRAEDDRVA
jgi:diguanylate cyclase (GGDEF)-like protein